MTHTLRALESMPTCDVVNGVKSNSKFPHFEGILRLDAALQVLYTFPVLISELRIIVGQQRGSLEGGQRGMHEWYRSMLPAVDEKLHRLCPSIIRILNDLLRKELCRYNYNSWVRSSARSKSESGSYRRTLKIWPSGYLSRIAFIVTDSGGRRCPNCCPAKDTFSLILSSPAAWE